MEARVLLNSFWWKPQFSSTTENWLFLFKKTPILYQVTVVNTCFKENARTFSKNFTTQEFKDWKKEYETYTKKKMFKEKMKPMIEKFQDQFYQLENKQAKGAKRCANITWELDGEKCLKKIFWKYLKDRICRIKEDLNYMPMIKNQNILATWRTFSNQKTYFMKDFTPTPQLPKLLLLHFLAKCLTLRKSLMKNLIFARKKYLQMRL